MTMKFAGQEGFYWWFGVVEDREDPQKLGRVKVRVHNFHGNKIDTPTDDLQWAPVLMQPTSASSLKVGISPTGIIVGSTVFGFFVDGQDGQIPMVLGTLHGIPDKNVDRHDVSLLARETNSINKIKTGPEPDSAYGAIYPYNKVIQTESGHVVEVDDTPNRERIHIYHRKGTYVEIDQNGRKVSKTVDNDYEIVVKDKIVYVEGNIDIEVRGNAKILVHGNAETVVKGNVDTTINGNCRTRVDGSYTLSVGGDIKNNGSTINLNNGSQGAARVGDAADSGDPGGAVGSNKIESGSSTVFIGG